jgi:hypothetical protein
MMSIASSDATTTHSSYRCVHCATPCASLYRQYTSSPSSIKLTACQTCGNDVDPYIEREWLLVSLDCILLRLPAYRHVLYHRLDSDSLSYRRMLQTLLASSILQSYLTWEACRTSGDVSVPFNKLMIQSIAGLLIFSVCGYTSDCFRRVFLAICAPTSFQVVTVFVLVWENTATVRILGSLLVLIYQAASMSVVMHHHWWLPLSLVGRALVGRLVAHLMGLPYQPCAGLEWKIAGEHFCLT